eukprot:7929978-Alexandrium_andersonii.AAC.1
MAQNGPSRVPGADSEPTWTGHNLTPSSELSSCHGGDGGVGDDDDCRGDDDDDDDDDDGGGCGGGGGG